MGEKHCDSHSPGCPVTCGFPAFKTHAKPKKFVVILVVWDI